MVTLKEAQQFVEQYHRHLSAPFIHKFSIGLEDNGELIGVAIVEIPKARESMDGETLEITRLCTLGQKNACSKLYSACIRAARALGAGKIITYTLEDEDGASLKASGFKYEGLCGGGHWNVGKTRSYAEQGSLFETKKKQPECRKKRWVKIL